MGQRVDPASALPGLAPFAADESLSFEPVEDRVQRAVMQDDGSGALLAHATCELVAVHGPAFQLREHEQLVDMASEALQLDGHESRKNFDISAAFI